MANLIDTIVNGALRVTGKIYANLMEATQLIISRASSDVSNPTIGFKKGDTLYGYIGMTGDGVAKIWPSTGSGEKQISTTDHTHSGYAVSQAIAVNADLNSITTPGFYNASGSNSIQNTPKAGQAFGLWVTKNAGGTYYSQYYEGYQGLRYVRQNQNGTWGAWTGIKYTDTVTTVTNNLTSTSTTDALSAAQGKALNDKFGSYVAKAGDTMTGPLTVNPGSAGNFKEGVRINQAANGWSIVNLGATANSAAGTETCSWLVGRRGSNAATGSYGVVGDFVIQRAGSDGSNGLTISQENHALFRTNSLQTTGSLRVGAQTVTSNSINGGCLQKYNATTKALEFTFD